MIKEVHKHMYPFLDVYGIMVDRNLELMVMIIENKWDGIIKKQST